MNSVLAEQLRHLINMQQDHCALTHTARYKFLVRTWVCKRSYQAQDMHFRIVYVSVYYPDLLFSCSSKQLEASDFGCQNTLPLAVSHFIRVNDGLKQTSSFELAINTDGVVGEKGDKSVLCLTINYLLHYLG